MKLKLIAIIVATSAIVGCNEKQNQQQQQRPPVSVTYNLISPTSVEVSAEFKGRVSAVTEAEVRPQVTGIIQSINVKDGQQVKKGQVLYKIDPSKYQAAYNQASASLESVKADIAAAKLKADRYKLLSSQKAISAQEADDAMSNYKKLVADLAEKKAALDLAKIELEYTNIKAPIDGVLGIATITPGALVTANQTDSINNITTLNPIYVDIAQPSKEFAKMNKMVRELGTKDVVIDVTINGGNTFKGKLNSYEYKVNDTTDSIKLRAIFDNKDKTLLPGMFGTSKVVYGINPNGIKVPLQSVVKDPNGSSFVYLVNNENKIEKSTVILSSNTGNEAVIESGVKSGDKVVFEGIDKIRLGDVVSPIENKI